MHSFDNSVSYLERLMRRREAAKVQRATAPKPPALHEQIGTWFAALSDEDKSRAWKMVEFRAIFNETPQKIGAALFDLGWTRKRMWRDDRPTARYWFKH